MLDLREKEILTAQVTNIEWDRIFLILDVEVDFLEDEIQNLEFFMVNGLYEVKGKFKVLECNNNKYKIKINITNNGQNRCYPLGTYNIYVCKGEEFFGLCKIALNMADKLEKSSRNFLYANRSKVYTVSFFVKDDVEDTIFEIYMMASAKCGMSFPKYGRFRKIFSNVPRETKRYLKNEKIAYKKYYYSNRKNLKGKNSQKTILFMSEQSDTLGANLIAVKDRMIQRGMDKEYRILTSARPASSVDQSRESWHALLKKIAESDMILIDDHAPVFDWLEIDKDTKIIQLWHAGAGFKSSGYSRWGHKGCPSPQSCHRQYTYGIAGSKNIIPFFSEVWGLNDEQVIPTGMPRMDEFLNSDFRKKKTKELYEKFPMCKGKKVILFAPTYRGKNRKEAYYPYNLIDFEKLYNICDNEYVVLFKMHPWVSAPVPIEEKYKDKFLDVGLYPNINDLFYITDLLITDYSSNIFEYSLMGNPMLFFAFDKVQYSFSRGFHRNYEESAPGKICYEFDDIIKAIEEKDFEEEKVGKYVKHHFDYIDSHSSDRVIDWIILDNMPDDIRELLKEKEQENERMAQMDFVSIMNQEKDI